MYQKSAYSALYSLFSSSAKKKLLINPWITIALKIISIIHTHCNGIAKQKQKAGE